MYEYLLVFIRLYSSFVFHLLRMFSCSMTVIPCYGRISYKSNQWYRSVPIRYDSSVIIFLPVLVGTLNFLPMASIDALDDTFSKAITVMTDTLDTLKNSIKTVDERTKNIYQFQKEQEKHAALLKDVRQNLQVFNKKGLDEMDDLEKEVKDLKTHIVGMETDLKTLKDRLEKVGTTLQRHIEMKRSMRPMM